MTRDPWPLAQRRTRRDICTLDEHDGAPFVMTRRHAAVGDLYAQVFVCALHDGDAAHADKINPSFGRKRCANRECLRRWEHPGLCP